MEKSEEQARKDARKSMAYAWKWCNDHSYSEKVSADYVDTEGISERIGCDNKDGLSKFQPFLREFGIALN